jgi:putative oxidoreductase
LKWTEEAEKMELINHLWSERMLSVLRIVAGLLFLEHGLAKLLGFPHVAMFDNLTLVSLIGLAGVIEIVGGALVTLGLFTRIAAFIMSGEMAFAYFMSHAARGFFPIVNGGELAVLYCFLFLYFAFAGGGPWSLDRLRSDRSRVPRGYDRPVSAGGGYR